LHQVALVIQTKPLPAGPAAQGIQTILLPRILKYRNSCSGGAAAQVIQTKPLLKFIQEQLFSWRCYTSNPNQTFAKIYTRIGVQLALLP
jgi:hypothetical protein